MKFLFLCLLMSLTVVIATAQSNEEKMRSVVFKSQEFCRAELKDFDFDARFSIVSATVYFTGANFKKLEMGTIKGSSLKPLEDLMKRCIPGSIVIFDDVKVIGPDKEVRTIAGLTLKLQ